MSTKTARETVREELMQIVKCRDLEVTFRFQAMDRLLALKPTGKRKRRIVVVVPRLKGEARKIMETQPIKLLDLTVRATNVLAGEWPHADDVGAYTMSLLTRKTEHEVLSMSRSSRAVLNEIKTKLAAFGLALRGQGEAER